MDSSQTLYVRRQGRVEGPWPMSKLLSEVKLNKLGRLHEVSVDGINWRRASDIEGLFVSVTARKRVGPPMPGSSRDDATDEIEIEADPAPAAASAVWHYSVDDQQFGPMSESDIVRDITAGRLPLDALVWREGYADWVTIAESHELMARLDGTWRNVRGSGTSAPRFTEPAAQSSRDAINHGGHPGFWLRLFAHVIDTLLVQVVVFIAAIVVGIAVGVAMAASGVADQDVVGGIGTVVGIFVGFLGSWLYYAVFESSPKQGTPGKLACGFVVTDMNGNRISFGKATARYFAMIFSAMTLGVGFIMCAFTEKKQCLHDVIAGCLMYKKSG